MYKGKPRCPFFMTIPSSLLGSLAHVSHLTLRTDRFAFTYTAWSTEGGIRCPAIVRHPSIPGEKRGGVEHAFTTVMDILPTVASPDLHDCPPDGIRPTDVLPTMSRPSGNSWTWLGFRIQGRRSATVPSCHPRGRAGRAGYLGPRRMYTTKMQYMAGNVSTGSLA
jgi:arylsulfatase A-like enzyme